MMDATLALNMHLTMPPLLSTHNTSTFLTISVSVYPRF